jgi:hypothetical protein
MTTRQTAIAWIGEDEFGNGEVGIKRAILGYELFPLVFMEGQRNAVMLQSGGLLEQLQAMANEYGKPLRLVRFVAAETIMTIEPKGKG